MRIIEKPVQHKHITKVVQKARREHHLIKINHTHGGADHPIRRLPPIVKHLKKKPKRK